LWGLWEGDGDFFVGGKGFCCTNFWGHITYSSWQLGANEKLNGLIRQYFPKKTKFEHLSIQEVKFVEEQLNRRPRKRFNYNSPLEEFNYLKKVAFVT